MQASKIDLRNTYAIWLGEGEARRLVRFRPTKVTTVRSRATGSPHDYKSTVTGWVDPDDLREGEEAEITINPETLQGEFTQFAELVAKKKAEEAAKAAEDKAKTDAAEQLADLLYKLTGLPRSPLQEEKTGWSNKSRWRRHDYNDPFRVSNYSVDVQAHGGGVSALLQVLQRLAQ